MKCIPVEQFGKDHWSMLVYMESCCVDLQGVLDKRRMRCNKRTHPMMSVNGFGWKKEYGTVLKSSMSESRMLYSHDDWDCLDDLIVVGFVELIGTMTNPVVKLTERGYQAANALRKHKAEGGRYASFDGPVAQW